MIKKKSREQLRHERFEREVNLLLSPIVAKYLKRSKSKFYLTNIDISATIGVFEVELRLKEDKLPIIYLS